MKVLKQSLLEISPLILHTNSSLHICLFSVHDWIAHLVHESYLWHEYDSSLKDVIMDHIHKSDKSILNWVAEIINGDITEKTLLYRHYLFAKITNAEITPVPHYLHLYILIASMLTKDVVFTSLSHSAIWEKIDEDLYPINILRTKLPLIKQYAADLMMREDVTPHQTLRDHGLLFSLSLLYGLYLVKVILIYEMTVKPERHLSIILNSISNTLIQLKGVFHNVETHWLSTDV